MTTWPQTFRGEKWREQIDVRDFIINNYTPYEGDGSFLAEATPRTKRLWEKCLSLIKEEHERGGVLSIDADRPSTITSHLPGYIDKELEIIVGLQTAP